MGGGVLLFILRSNLGGVRPELHKSSNQANQEERSRIQSRKAARKERQAKALVDIDPLKMAAKVLETMDLAGMKRLCMQSLART